MGDVLCEVPKIQQLFAMCLHVHTIHYCHLDFPLSHLIDISNPYSAPLCALKKAWPCTSPIEQATCTYTYVHTCASACVCTSLCMYHQRQHRNTTQLSTAAQLTCIPQHTLTCTVPAIWTWGVGVCTYYTRTCTCTCTSTPQRR
jgi:hypothetical protein